jgi:AcrR family transcriptional regulator
MSRQARPLKLRESARGRAVKPLGDTRLTRQRILAAGLDLLATRGVAGLSMRALAEVLGTAPMSLYRHVRSKDELLSAIAAGGLERLELDLPQRGAWSERAAAWMHSLRTQLLRSPAVVSILVQHGQYTPALLRATNTLLRILRDAGFEPPDAVRAWREIMWSTLGFVSSEIRGPAFSPSFYMQAVGEPRPTSAATLRPEDLEEVAAHMPHLLRRDLDEVFSSIVKHLLAGLAEELAETLSRGRTEATRVASRGRR